MSSGDRTTARIDLPASKGIIWGEATPVDTSRRQSTTPQNALTGLPTQRPVQLFTLDPSNYIGPNAIPLPREKTRAFDKVPPTALQKYINFCADAGRRGCAAFDDETFRRICGICTDGEVAGIYISETDRANQTDPKTGLPYEDIRPTFGTCPYKSFTVSAERCRARREQEKCLKEQSRDVRVVNQLAPERHVNKNCAVNLETGELNLFPRRDPAGVAELLLGGRGFVVVTAGAGTGTAATAGQKVAEGQLADGVRVRLLSATEGLVLNLTVDGTTTAGNATAIAGVLIGPTAAGPYVIDISKIIAVDTVTGLSPRRQGFINIEGDVNNRVFRVVPGVGQTRMSLTLRLPLTFLSNVQQPVIRTAESIQQLGMEVCRNPSSRPGNYSIDCLRYLWSLNGCTSAGKGYPRDLKTAPALLWNEGSQARSFEEINSYLQGVASLAHSGVTVDGRRGRPAEVSEAVNFCLGAGKPANSAPVQQTVRIPPPPLPEPTGLKSRVQGRPSTIRDWLGAAAQAFNQFIGVGNGLPGV